VLIFSLGKDQDFTKPKIADFQSKFQAKFLFIQENPPNAPKIKVMRSFLLIMETISAEFSSLIENDILKIHEIFKKKVNFSGYHENFQSMKKIGQGNFASVSFS